MERFFYLILRFEGFLRKKMQPIVWSPVPPLKKQNFKEILIHKRVVENGSTESLIYLAMNGQVSRLDANKNRFYFRIIRSQSSFRYCSSGSRRRQALLPG